MQRFQSITARLPARLAGMLSPVAEKLDIALSDDGPRSVAARSALFTYAMRVLAAIVAYVGQVVLARMLGAYDYGVYAIVWVWVVILSTIAGIGYPTGLVRFIPELRDAGRIAELRTVMVKGPLVNIGLCTALALAGIAAILAFPSLVHSAFLMPMVLAAVCLPMMTMVDNQDGVAQAFDWPDLVTIPPFLIRPLFILAVFIAITVAGVPASATSAMIATVIGVYTITLLQFVVLRRRVRARIGDGPMEGPIRPWIVAAIPMMLVESFFFLIIYTDVMVAGWFIEPDQVAVYYAAAKTLALVHFVSFAIRIATMHKIAQYHAAEDMVGLKRTVADAVRWTFWPSLFICAFLVVTGEFVLSIFGDGFEEGMLFLAILLVGVVIRATVGPAEAMLTMAKAQKTAAWVYGAVFAVNLGLNLALIPTIGLIGAAIATAGSMAFETVLLAITVKRRLGFVSFIGAVRQLDAKGADAEPESGPPPNAKVDPVP
ncbi:MAG: lipopolysaccharide biosynthesis protein [Devosiaceae bacterium]|nr:lipopolysaccharide biosynthesis protein [Devosiaceae bacterium MH13]